MAERIGRLPIAHGYPVITGGGPGAMEAAQCVGLAQMSAARPSDDAETLPYADRPRHHALQ
jgi:hypothetical protein